jgi:hypothetical protein
MPPMPAVYLNNMKKYLMLSLACLACIAARAQYSITGKVTDKASGQPIELATVQLLKSDSSFAGGVNSKSDGSFALSTKKAGSYIVKVSFVGYTPQYRKATVGKAAEAVKLGTVALGTNDVALKGATITAKAAKVEMKADTFQYNASAYRTPVGSTLENLVEQLPGAEVSDDGTIKINGKTVSQILMNGKDFFKGDTKIAMKNLPTELVSSIKAYDKKSDYSKQTGIDDGNEETVLDVGLKKELKESWVSNISGGYGTKDRYTGDLFVNRYTDHDHETLFANANNSGDRHFGPGRGGGSGLTANKNMGFDAGWDNGKKEGEAGHFDINGNIRWDHSATDRQSRSNSETFLNTGSSSSFANSKSQDYSHSTNFNMGATLRWNPDTMTTVMFGPQFSHSQSRNSSQSRSATFNSDPYAIDGITDPLETMFADSLAALRDIAVNTNHRISIGSSQSTSASYWGMVVRKLNSRGRSIALHSNGSWGNSKSKSFSRSDINYFQAASAGQNTFTNQYSNNPSENWSLSGRLSYSEPITKNLFAQASYDYSYSYSNSDRSLYQLDSLAGWRDMYSPVIGSLPTDADSLRATLNMRNSQYATYKNYTHRASVGIRYNSKTINFHAAVDFNPQRTKLEYQKDKLDTTVVRNVFNVSPNVRLRYKISNTSQLDLRYRGRSSQPSMTDLLDVTDDSNPLNISKGNPGLKPSWNNYFEMFYNNYIPTSQTGWMTRITFNQTSNSISNAMHYDETTGVRTTRPENINGNWDTNGDFMFNTSFGKDKSWSINTFTGASYSNSVGYVSTQTDTVSQKNTTRNLNLREHLRLTYRTGLFEFGVRGGVNYQHARNELQKNANLDTWSFNYGTEVNATLPWNMQISTDIRMNSRRGYSDNTMNTNELIWNAQIAQSFLKGNAATLSVQFYDILHNQSNVSRSISAQMRSDSWNNSINSYIMVKFLYRLNIFGGSSKGGDDNFRQGPGGFRGGPGRGGPGGGPGGRR